LVRFVLEFKDDLTEEEASEAGHQLYLFIRKNQNVEVLKTGFLVEK